MPVDCFTPLSTRLLSSSAGTALLSPCVGGPSGAASWAPAQDLLAVGLRDGAAHLHRLGWDRVLSAQRDKHPGADDDTCSTTALAWRPDGKALALSCRCGYVSLLSVESKAMAASWRPAASAQPAPITCLRWVESLTATSAATPAVPRGSDAALLQALYLRAHGDAPSGVRRALQEQEAVLNSSSHAGFSGASNAALPATERAPLYFDALPSLDAALELFTAQGLPEGAPVPAQANAPKHGVHRSARQVGTAVAASSSATALRGILHDALEVTSPASSSLLLIGDAAGRFWARASGTLDVLHGVAAPVINVEWCGLSGLLSVAARRPSADGMQQVVLHTRVCASLVTRTPELLQLVQHVQQVQLLNEYIKAALEQMQAKWKAARRSFHNKMAGLNDTLERLASEAKEAREADAAAGRVPEDDSEEEEGDTLDIQGEWMNFLLLGVPSYAFEQFVSSCLSAGNLQKSFDLVATACTECAAISALPLAEAAEQLVFRCEQLRALSCTPGAASLGLELTQCSALLASAASFWRAVQQALDRLQRSKSGFDEFGRWLVSQVRLINDEHENNQRSQQEEKDFAAIPSYGPFDSGRIMDFIQTELEEDLVGEAIGNWNDKPAAVSSSPAQDRKGNEDEALDAIPPFSPALGSTSLTGNFVRCRTSFEQLLKQPARTISAQCVDVHALDTCDASEAVDRSHNPAGAAAAVVEPLVLFEAPPFTPAWLADATPPLSPSWLQSGHNVLGTGRTVALRHISTREENRHMVAFLCPPLGDAKDPHASSQLVSILQYRSMHSSAALPVGSSAPLPAKHLALLVPPVPHAVPPEQQDRWRSQVVSVQLYSDQYLLLLVQYQADTSAAAAGPDASSPSAAAGSSSVSTKIWMLDLEACEGEQWNTLPPLAAQQSLASSIAAQLEAGEAHLLSLLSAESSPSPFPLAPLSEASTRARSFPGILGAVVALNGNRGLAALFVAARGKPGVPPGLEAPDEDEAEEEEKSDSEFTSQAALLLQSTFKPTRRVMLIDMVEDPEEDEEPAADSSVAVDDGEAKDDTQDAAMDESTSTPARSGSARSSLGPSTTSASKKGASNASSPMLLSILMALMLMLCILPRAVRASEGDRDSNFRQCATECSSRCSILESEVAQGVHPDTGKSYPRGSDPFAVLPESLVHQWDHLVSSPPRSGKGGQSPLMIRASIPAPNSLLERLVFRWDCSSNCAYHCMHANELYRRERDSAYQKTRLARGLKVQQFEVFKYHGKWPFVRLGGMQEFFSSWFSILNAVPHLYWLVRLRKEFGPTSVEARRTGITNLPMLPLWTTYALVYTNTWIWSAVFHARDVVWTERLDYFCASAGLSFSLCVVIIRMLGVRGERPLVRTIVFLTVGAAFLAHIGYLQLIHFDYGWNMRVSIGVGVLHSLLWLTHCARNWKQGFQGRMLFVTLALWACAALEVFDFPPLLGGLLDAHAIWHGLTPPLGYAFYTWVEKDLEAQRKEKEQEQIKNV